MAASACVGIIIGIVQQTGIATDFSAAIKGVVETNLLLALVGIMVCSLILGMGVPSVVCYLLMATLMGSLLSELGVAPLAARAWVRSGRQSQTCTGQPRASCRRARAPPILPTPMMATG